MQTKLPLIGVTVMFIAIAPDGHQIQADSIPTLISDLKTKGHDGTYTLYKQVATVLRAPEVLVLPASEEGGQDEPAGPPAVPADAN